MTLTKNAKPAFLQRPTVAIKSTSRTSPSARTCSWTPAGVPRCSAARRDAAICLKNSPTLRSTLTSPFYCSPPSPSPAMVPTERHGEATGSLVHQPPCWSMLHGSTTVVGNTAYWDGTFVFAFTFSSWVRGRWTATKGNRRKEGRVLAAKKG